MTEHVEIVSGQLSVPILMTWKPVIKSIHSFKMHIHIHAFKNFLSCPIYLVIICTENQSTL